MIFVCGEALVDLFVLDIDADSISTKAVLGGSPFNVAIALSRLGQPVAFYGGISRDQFGALLLAKLESHSVDLSHVVRSDQLTTISVVATDREGSPSYSFHGEGKADRLLSLEHLPATLPTNVEAITFGSYTLVTPPVCDTFFALAKREAGRRTISIDPNIRPNVTPNMLEWGRRFDAFLPHADIVKASDEDLKIAYGCAVDIESVVERWHVRGPSLVIVTQGPHGATGYLRGHAPVSVQGRKVTVEDTVGAGDTFHAATLARLAAIGRLAPKGFAKLNPLELQEAMQYAVAASSVTCTRAGAVAPTSAEVEGILSSRPDR